MNYKTQQNKSQTPDKQQFTQFVNSKKWRFYFRGNIVAHSLLNNLKCRIYVGSELMVRILLSPRKGRKA